MAGHDHSAECISEALIREYLSRKGLKNILELFNKELARDKKCITNRAALLTELHLVKQAKKIKADPTQSPRTVLEIVVNNQLVAAARKRKSSSVATSEPSNLGLGDAVPSTSLEQLHIGSPTKTQKYLPHKLPVSPKGPKQETRIVIRNKEKSHTLSTSSLSFQNEEKINHSQVVASDFPATQMAYHSKKYSYPLLENAASSPHLSSDLQMFDLSDEEQEDTAFVSSPYYISMAKPDSVEYITSSQIADLRTLLFGNPKQSFGFEWTDQNFVFNNHPDVCYGLVQKKGGPCGVLAVVQGYILKELLFDSIPGAMKDGLLRPSPKAKLEALIRALGNILWRCGRNRHAVIAMPSNRVVVESVFPPDGFLDCLVLNHFNTYQGLLDFLSQTFSWQHIEKPGACVGFLYSAIFSRGINRIKEDMDDPKTALIGRHGYCTQEMVNLLLVGQAVSNVFDGHVELNSGGQETTSLRGITAPAELGLLSLFEHYNSCKVGENLKEPQYPIWLVLSESHFTVLFATSADFKTQFQLYYYDMLARQSHEICLTITLGKYVADRDHTDDLVPPLEHCIRTKWPTAHIDWNNAEPLL